MKSQNTSLIIISQLATSDFNSVESMSAREKTELLSLLKSSYPHYGYKHIFDNYPCYKQLFIYRMRINQTLVASRQFLIVDDVSKSPSWAIDMNDTLQTKRFAIGSRAIVHPLLRGHGLGSHLVKTVNQELYSTHGVEAIFGSSTNMAAIELYFKHGAKLWEDDLKKLRSYKNTVSARNDTTKIININNSFNTRISSPLRYIYQNDTLNDIKNEKCDFSPHQINSHLETHSLLST